MSTAILIIISIAFIAFLAEKAWKGTRPLTKGKKPILCLDFDGVINSYTSGWQGPRALPDPPVEGAIRFLTKAVDDFEVHIFSSRSNYFLGRHAMKKWLWKNLIDELKEPLDTRDYWYYNIFAPSYTRNVFSSIHWSKRKPPALLTIDDRALCFDGNFPDLEEVKNFKPWYKK